MEINIMNLRIIRISWSKLFIFIFLTAATHFAMDRYAAYPLAALVSPKFIPLSAAEEKQFDFDFYAHKKSKQENAERTCGFYRSAQGSVWESEYKRCMGIMTISSLVHPKTAHEYNVIYPMTNEIRGTYLPIVFGFIYAIISIFILLAAWELIRKKILPPLLLRLNQIKSKLYENHHLHTNKHLSSAIKQLDDLENLYQRGMIDENIFTSKKEEIKRALDTMNNRHGRKPL